MTPEQIQDMQKRIAALEAIVKFFVYPTEYRFPRPIKGTASGLRIGSLSTDKLSFYNKTPIAQWASGIGRQDVINNTGAAMNVGAMFDGAIATTYYSVGDIVAALKAYGLLAP